MSEVVKQVLSASRRTDIPAFYLDWFMSGIRKGVFTVENPYNRRLFSVPATPADVHAIVFWSKNFARFLDGGYGDRLARMGYHLLFQFTINSESLVLEPRIPPLRERLKQLRALTERFPPAAVIWRFDPICFFRIGNGPPQNNLHDFRRIADVAAECGIERCITSFVDLYGKVRRRTAVRKDLQWLEPASSLQIEVVVKLAKTLKDRGIRLALCCERELLEELPGDVAVESGQCISHDWIERVYGGRLSNRPDKGQRRHQGCGCMESKDIGSYRLQPCYHRCLFCYANPAPENTGTDTRRLRPVPSTAGSGR